MRDRGTVSAPDALAAELANAPDVVRSLLARHVPDGRGHCAVCRCRGVAPAWPCRLRALAATAQRHIDRAARLR